MTTGVVARRYANALFDVAHAHGVVDACARALSAFAEMMSASPELSSALGSPMVPPAKKVALIDALLARAGDVPAEVGRLLRMLAERDRLLLVTDMAAAFAARVREDQHQVRAQITTAVPLSEARRSALASALGRAVDRQVTVDARVDPAIVGGAVARVGDVVYDGSIARQLELMKQRLLANA